METSDYAQFHDDTYIWVELAKATAQMLAFYFHLKLVLAASNQQIFFFSKEILSEILTATGSWVGSRAASFCALSE